MILNNAKQIYLGETPVSKIYRGEELVWSANDLPEGYTRLAYLEQGSGKSWIDTGILPSNSIIFETRIRIATVNDDYFCSVRKSSATQTRYYLLNMNKDKGFVTTKSVWPDGSNLIGITGNDMLNTYFNIKTSIYDTGMTMTVNGESFSVRDTTSSLPTTPLPLFGYRVAAGTSINTASPVGTRCCYAKFTVGGVVVRDLVPVLDTEGVACMYDRATGETLYSKGGAFNYGLIE